MLTYRHEPGAKLTLPPRVLLPRFHLAPEQPFGASATGGRTAVRAKPVTLHFNANTGQHSIASAEPLSPLEVTIEGTG